MGYRIMALLLACFMVTGFSWGRKAKDETKKEEKKSSYSSYSSEKQTTSRSAVKKPVRSGAPAEDVDFPKELIGSLAKGSEQERKARIESLKRLSAALSQMNRESQSAE